MPVRLRTPLEGQLRHGVYLEDGECLYRVLDAAEGHVKLENCKQPNGPPAWLPVRDVVDQMRLVRAK